MLKSIPISRDSAFQPFISAFQHFSISAFLALLSLNLAGAADSSVGSRASQPTYVALRAADLTGFDLSPVTHPPAPRTGRRVPPLTRLAELAVVDLPNRAVPLPEAETQSAGNFFAGRFGRLETENGARLFNPEIILVKFRGAPHVAALRVEPLRELDALETLRQRTDIEFAELDSYARRQFNPDDPLIANQWHHAVIGSFAAWDQTLGEPFVRIAIVDTPFQMNHPDLAAHTDPGWDVVNGLPITTASGLDHSTLGAGMAAAVIGNQLGIAGASNCRILPININGAVSEMYDAVIWAADHGVRVVNISWDGGNSDALNVAAAYLKSRARGVLAMAGVNGIGFLNYTNQPDIYCISMTDAADNQRSRFGNHIDFAAPGWAVYSTTTNGGYTLATGTSYSTPLFCGVVAALMSINPTLNADEVIELLRNTAADLGQPGWDQYFGWGRINFASAAAAVNATRPFIIRLQMSTNQAVATVTNKPGLAYSLWKTLSLGGSWNAVTNVVTMTNGGFLMLTDPAAEANAGYYRVEARVQ